MAAKALSIGIADANEIALEATASEALATAAIEDERLDLAAVRSSVLRKLGFSSTGPVDRHVDGLIELLHDATTRTDIPLDKERLCGWQASLFPTGFSGVHRITTGSRGAYYEALNAASRGDVDVTTWVQWFIRQCTAAYDTASEAIAQALLKRDFWQQATPNKLSPTVRRQSNCSGAHVRSKVGGSSATAHLSPMHE